MNKRYMVNTVRVVAEFRDGGIRGGGDCDLRVEVKTLYGVVTHHSLSVDGEFFAAFVPATDIVREYRMASGSDLLKIGAGARGKFCAVHMEPRQVYESLGDEVAARVVASELFPSGGYRWTTEWFEAWCRVFGLLSVQRAVSLAMTHKSLVSRLSPQAAAAYAERRRCRWRALAWRHTSRRRRRLCTSPMRFLL